MSYSYDRRTVVAMGPASRLKDAEQYIKGGDRQIEQAKAVLHGLSKEMDMMTKHMSDHDAKKNAQMIQHFADQLDDIDDQIDHLLKDMDHMVRNFR
jgi:esterase/lipase